MTINLEKRNCPICRTISTNISEIDPDINPVSNKQIIKDYWDGSFKNNVFFPYFRCKCGLLFNREFPDKTSLNNLYSNREDNVIFGDLTLDIKTKKNYLFAVARHMHSTSIHHTMLMFVAPSWHLCRRRITITCQSSPKNYKRSYNRL